MFRPTAALVLVGAVLSVLAAAPVTDESLGGNDLSRWIDGPVRYLATAEETRTFRSLSDDDARAMFVERFWLRRDPTPDTLTNEYRTLFWERVQHANSSFTDSSWPGWKSDRGKVYILYGPPSEVQEYANLDAGSGPNASRGVIRWVYEGRPGGRTDLDAVTVVPFVRDVTGEYRLTYDPVLSSVFFDDWGIRDGQVRRFENYLTAIGGVGRRSELSVMLDLGRLQEVPPMERILIERVETQEDYAVSPLPVQIERFRIPESGGTRVVLSLRFPGRALDGTPALLARFTAAGAEREERLLGEGSFRFIDDGAGGVAAQGRIVLEPGSWELLVVAVDPVSGASSLNRSTVAAPPDSADLALSDVVVASSIEPLGSRALATWDEPFVYGPFRAVPRVDLPLRHGDALELLFRVESGDSPFRVAYRLEGREDDGRWIELGRPAETTSPAADQAWQLPIGDRWPAGDYRVVVQVEDSRGRRAEATVPFELVDGPG